MATHRLRGGSARAHSGFGATHLGAINIGHVNSAAGTQTVLSGTVDGPVFRAVNGGNSAALRGDSPSGIGVNGISTSGTGQFGQSTSGRGLWGQHTGSTGGLAGVEGDSASTDANSAGVLGKNTGGGPGLSAIVNAGAAPLKVNSSGKVANLNSDLLDGLDSARFWQLGGNAGTAPGTDFLGTSDNTALELRVNGQRALRLEPTADAPNVIGGEPDNSVCAGCQGATIAGGGLHFYANHITSDFATIGGGTANTADGSFSTVAGGRLNSATNGSAAVGGGESNVASGAGATVSGGLSNTASGELSFAAGSRAKATHNGSFVWADSTAADFGSTLANQFNIRTQNGVRVHTSGTWDLANTNGDLMIGNDTYRLKMGVALGGGGAGDVYIRSHGGTGRIFLGSNMQNALQISGQDVQVFGTLTKGAGSFKTDHPLAPSTKYLSHSFVESPDMKNVYDGIAVTDARGFATVRLPRYFQALNRSFRYQLTSVGRQHWNAKVAIWNEIADNRFTIRSDQAHMKVSWQVTGIRKDAYANAHRIKVVEEKVGGERGTYLHPELYGKPARSGGIRGRER